MKISFIVPAFNAQDYLARCLDSILSQPIDDFEIVVIDDGSSDKTPDILREYQIRDTRLKFQSQVNQGQGAARSLGLTLASGEYIWFVDSDDWLLPSVLPRITRILSEKRPDVMVVNFEFAFDYDPAVPSSLVPPHLAGEMIDPRADPSTFSTVSCWSAPPWRLISRREHLLRHGITFAKGVFYEDHPFAIHLMLTAEHVFVDGPVSYSYYQRASSTTKVNDRKAFDFLTVRTQCLELFRRFDVYERFAPIVVGYLAPANFYHAHVAEPFRKEFLQRLRATLTESDIDFIARHGDAATKLLSEAAVSDDPGLMERRGRVARLRDRYSRAGLRRFTRRLSELAASKVVSALSHAKAYVFKKTHHEGIDLRGSRFLRIGVGTRVEAICIDVRIKQEDRPYVEVGNYSHIGGTFVFERGVGRITVGDKSSIGGGCKIICTQEGGIHIGNNVMLSWDCTLMDSNAHSLDPDIRANDAYDWKCGVDSGRLGSFKDWSQVRSAPIHIEDNAWLGFETAVLKGVRIGRGAVVGSRSLVATEVPPYCVYAGNPARFVRLVPREHWGWDDIVEASQGDPSMQQMLKDAYLHRDLVGSLDRFRQSGEFLETLAEFHRYAPSARTILDVGGGGGVMAVAFALEGYRVTLVEPSVSHIAGVAAARELVRYAAQKFDETIAERIKIVPGAIEDFESTDTFDIAYCRQVAHHFSNPVRALKNIRARLSIDGVILLAREHVIFDDEDLKAFYSSHPFHRYTGGEKAYHAEQYREFIASAGMQLIRQYSFGETLINCFPHDPEYCRSVDERSIAGRPYSFIARNAGVCA